MALTLIFLLKLSSEMPLHECGFTCYQMTSRVKIVQKPEGFQKGLIQGGEQIILVRSINA